MTLLYRNPDWMYDFLLEEATGRYYLLVVCGTSAWYDMCLCLTAAEATRFGQDLALGTDAELTQLARQVVQQAPAGIPGREYRR
ncbi:hypothetical protein [Hymenobacter metallicola]|uniref:Uncharacterized protein n=1 Tax=Hymenobacter metallicola TaxID=2563114 RepID=A0A4Z0QGN0_9BACT|nr:hypothetical protein [Hymenobacter metallicola]TGE29218.1 hypothetical protein E5K02_07130 [Hymenobacter metallicola]